MRALFNKLFVFPLVVLLAACTAAPSAPAASAGSGGAEAPQGQLRIVTTVSPITNIAYNIAGDKAQIAGIVPEGVNSHTFEPAPSDAKVLAQADLIFANGLRLEEPTLKLAEANLKQGAEIVLLGEQTGTVRNFRAFYTTDQRDLTVAPMARASVLDGARDDSAQGTFVVRGDGSGSLQGVRTMPWQSLLVREDGLLDVAKGGITLEDDGSEIAVVNRSGRDLADVLVFRNGSTWHFAKVAAGERVTTAGRGASSGGASSHSNADDGNGPKSFVQINWYGLRTSLAGGERIADQWASVESSMGYGHDWSGGSDTFLLARMEGGASEDSGLPVKKSTTLVRVTRGSR